MPNAHKTHDGHNHHTAHHPHHQSLDMDKVKIKRVKRNKKQITTQEKIVAGLGVGSTLMGGAGVVAPKIDQTQFVRTTAPQGESAGSKIKDTIKKIFGSTFGAQTAHAMSITEANAILQDPTSSPDDQAMAQQVLNNFYTTGNAWGTGNPLPTGVVSQSPGAIAPVAPVTDPTLSPPVLHPAGMAAGSATNLVPTNVAPDMNNSLTGYVTINGQQVRLSVLPDGSIYGYNADGSSQGNITQALAAQGVDTTAIVNGFNSAPQGAVYGVDPSFAVNNNPPAQQPTNPPVNVSPPLVVPGPVPVVKATGDSNLVPSVVAPDMNNSLTGFVTINGVSTRLSIIQNSTNDGPIFDINGNDITQQLIDQGIDVTALRNSFASAQHGSVSGVDPSFAQASPPGGSGSSAGSGGSGTLTVDPNSLSTATLKVQPDVNNSLTGMVTINGSQVRLSVIPSTGQVFDQNGNDITSQLDTGTLTQVINAFKSATFGQVQGVNGSFINDPSLFASATLNAPVTQGNITFVNLNSAQFNYTVGQKSDGSLVDAYGQPLQKNADGNYVDSKGNLIPGAAVERILTTMPAINSGGGAPPAGGSSTDTTPYNVFQVSSPLTPAKPALAAYVGTDASGNVINQVVYIQQIAGATNGQPQFLVTDQTGKPITDANGNPITFSQATIDAITAKGPANYLSGTISQPPPSGRSADKVHCKYYWAGSSSGHEQYAYWFCYHKRRSDQVIYCPDCQQ